MKTDGGNEWTYSRPRKRGNGIYVVVALVVTLELIAVLYLYAFPSGGATGQVTFPTSASTGATATGSAGTASTSKATTTTTTHPPPDVIKVPSASISNDSLYMAVHNLGPNATTLLSVTGVCTPKFQACYDYKALAGSYLHETFVLPAGQTFNASLSRVCTIAISSCKSYLPVANATYYLQVTFTFSDGSTVLVHVSATANNTWSPYPTAILGITSPSLTVAPANLTGLFNVTVDLNDSLPYASLATKLDGYLKPSNAFSGTILTNSTGCLGSGTGNFTVDGRPLNVSFTADCSQPLTVAVSFSTVLTGITPGPYYSVAIRDTTDIDKPAGNPDYDAHSAFYFAVWVLGTT